jgi:hypothetical protein
LKRSINYSKHPEGFFRDDHPLLISIKELCHDLDRVWCYRPALTWALVDMFDCARLNNSEILRSRMPYLGGEWNTGKSELRFAELCDMLLLPIDPIGE